jgi:chromate transport protein ChrA
MSIDLNIKVIYGLIPVVCILLASMVYMSVKMNSGVADVTAAQWNCFRYTTWTTVGTCVLLVIASVTLLIRQQLQ